MKILLVERDPVVRIDMKEMLSAAFPEAELTAVETLEDASEVAKWRVVLLDASLDEFERARARNYWKDPEAKIILTNSLEPVQGYIQLQRPFTEDMVISTIRDTLESQRSQSN